jgi:hypothetical protein
LTMIQCEKVELHGSFRFGEKITVPIRKEHGKKQTWAEVVVRDASE